MANRKGPRDTNQLAKLRSDRLVTTTAATVLGIFVIVAKCLFPHSGKK